MAAVGNSASRLLKRAVDDQRAGRFKAAERGYRAVLKMTPDHFDALHMLGVVAHQTGRHGEAVALIDRAIALNGDMAVAHFNKSAALRADGKMVAAIAALQRAVALNPGYSDAYHNLGAALQAQGQLDESEAAYRQAIALQPDYAPAHNNLAALLQIMGRSNDAAESWRAAIRHRPDLAGAYRNLATQDPASMEDHEVVAMEDMLAAGTLSDNALLNLCFGLAEVYEAREECDASFTVLSRGNAIKRRSITFSIEAERPVALSMAENFGLETPVDGCQSTLPIFVVGMPRSGTSLVEQILASHPSVFGAGELTAIGGLARPYLKRRDGLPVWSWGDSVHDMADLGARYVAETRTLAPTADRIVDKMPQNFLFLGFIATILPKAKVIHIGRDPLDTCLACYKRLFDHGEHFSYDQTELGAYCRIYDSLMVNWNARLSDTILNVDYETLVAEPQPVIETMLDHVGLSWDDPCLEFHRTKRPVRTASAAQVRRPLYTSSVGRWRRYKEHLGPLIKALGSVVSVNGEAPNANKAGCS